MSATPLVESRSVELSTVAHDHHGDDFFAPVGMAPADHSDLGHGGNMASPLGRES